MCRGLTANRHGPGEAPRRRRHRSGGAALATAICWAIGGCPGIATTGGPAAATVQAPRGTGLDALRRDYEPRVGALPAGDADDPIPLPPWFRTLLRERLGPLPESGRPQYPRQALELLGWLRDHPGVSTAGLEERLGSLARAVPAVRAENLRRSPYPPEWERKVPNGTRLDRLRRQLDEEFDLLPEADLEDQSPLPIWFRVYLRKQHPDLPVTGPAQYPRTANRILQWMLEHPDAEELPAPPGPGARLE
jgi:hypothetical protein